MKGECSFCPREDVILFSGHNYCPECISFVDQPIIHQWLLDEYPKMKEKTVVRVLTDLFDTKWYSFVTFSKLHSQYPRGGLDDLTGSYNIPQHDYILSVFVQYVTQHHATYRNAYEHISEKYPMKGIDHV